MLLLSIEHHIPWVVEAEGEGLTATIAIAVVSGG
jgi:hypothetical protein